MDDDATRAPDPSGIDAIPAPEGATTLIDTDYTIGQDNVELQVGPFGLDIHNPVFLISGLTIVAFVVLTLAFQNSVEPLFAGLRDFLTSTLAWFFLGAANIFVILCLVLIASPLGRVRLGGKEATPDYSYIGWFAMLFAAGMGIGLMFYGVSEPISHYSTAIGGVSAEAGVRTDWAPLGGAAGDQAEAVRLGMAATIFHWALHPWAIYAIVALALALFSYNKGLPLTIRSIFYPIFGERVWGWTGHVIDVLAVLATLFGLATSLGFGAEQANAGLAFLFGLPNNDGSKVVLILAITGVALISVVAGLDAGVKRLSEINMVLAALLLGFVILVGPTVLILGGFFQNLWAYVEYLPALSNPVGREDANFSQGWTAFYWAWWISWSPFVGMFIARVSRGRTVREFLTCVLIIPSLVSVLWMTAFGGTAIDQIVSQGITAVQDAPLELKLFEMLQGLPLTQITSFVGILLVIVFFVTSSDSGSLVIDTITAGGKVNAPVPQRVFWAVFEGLIAVALLLGGGLAALQAMAVSTGFPFTIVLLLGCFAIVKGLMSEPR
ncbi:BCCT family transporter [Salinarimonas rosea]|uniref:BCCT family transporter n=1 Tax=Salinarimonas rosea TaxID=552063 RepID=UPI00041EFB34|nr:BCCT family transporter [Salinarimonas rosea]